MPLTTDEDWRHHGAEKLSAWKRQAEEEKAALAVVQNDVWPWVSHVHTERMIEMYDHTLVRERMSALVSEPPETVRQRKRGGER